MLPQSPPCRKSYLGLTNQFTKFDPASPISDDMPNEVRESYLWIDETCHKSDYYKFSDFLNANDLNTDTLKQIIKYYFQFWDYNFALAMGTESSVYYNPYSNYSKYVRSPNDTIHLIMIKLASLLDARIRELDGRAKELFSLVRSGIITHLRVDSIKNTLIEEIPEDDRQDLLVVNAEVIDPIKGKLVPAFKSLAPLPDSAQYNDPEPRLVKSEPGVKLQFAYWLSDKRLCNEHLPLVDSLGNPWTKPGNEYVVFLFPFPLCGDSINTYYHLSPAWCYTSCVFGMYPVIDGKVYNPMNEFNVPDGISVELFKKKLRQDIDDILNKRTPDLTLVENANPGNSDNINLRLESNIVSDFLSVICFSHGESLHVEIKIYDIFGNCVEFQQKENHNINGFSIYKLDVSSFAQGSYFVRVKCGEQEYHSQFLIIR